jgi:hypothetical protein
MTSASSAADLIRATPGCSLEPPGGPPPLEPRHALPDDLRAFYEACGGARLFEGAHYAVRISGPAELVPSNPEIIGEQVDDDITSSWYIVARDDEGNAISIDLEPARLGRCYDSFVDVHGVAGSCAVVALSFTELVERLVASAGGHWYWLEPDWQPIGDAYELLP